MDRDQLNFFNHFIVNLAIQRVIYYTKCLTTCDFNQNDRLIVDFFENIEGKSQQLLQSSLL